MYVLGIDTCLGAVSVALGQRTPEGCWTHSEFYEERQTGHAERLMPMIAELLDGAGLTAGDLQRVAVTVGPGSFTGVRTGLSAARAFRLAAGLDVVGVTSLALIAHRAFDIAGGGEAARLLLVAVDARRDRLYVQLFRSNSRTALLPPAEMTVEEATALLSGGRVLLAGSGASAVAAAASAAGKPVEVVGAQLEPRAADLVELAWDLEPLDRIAPIYIRPPDAKPQTAQSLARTP